MEKIGFLGLGRMGGNMVRRLRRAKLPLVVWNRAADVALALADETGCEAMASIEALVDALPKPRTLWLMLPAGEATRQVLARLTPLFTPGDLVVDGANAYYKDSIARGQELAARGIQFVDAGVSGGIWGLENGYCLMLGGEGQAIDRLRPYIEALAPAADRGWLHCGPVGSGHFVKMVHNGIEYGMMQALAEGLNLIKHKTEFDLDPAAISELWRHGSVVRSWLLDLTADFLARDNQLEHIVPLVADSGEGRWTAQEAIEQGVPAPVISLALMMRFASQGKSAYGDKLLAMMRLGFGGHAVQGAEYGRD